MIDNSNKMKDPFANVNGDEPKNLREREVKIGLKVQKLTKGKLYGMNSNDVEIAAKVIEAHIFLENKKLTEDDLHTIRLLKELCNNLVYGKVFGDRAHTYCREEFCYELAHLGIGSEKISKIVRKQKNYVLDNIEDGKLKGELLINSNENTFNEEVIEKIEKLLNNL